MLDICADEVEDEGQPLTSECPPTSECDGADGTETTDVADMTIDQMSLAEDHLADDHIEE